MVAMRVAWWVDCSEYLKVEQMAVKMVAYWVESTADLTAHRKVWTKAGQMAAQMVAMRVELMELRKAVKMVLIKAV